MEEAQAIDVDAPGAAGRRRDDLDRRKERRRRRRARRGAFFALCLRVLKRMLDPLPVSAVRFAGRAGGRLGHALVGRSRRRALAHLALALPDVGDGERRRIASDCFAAAGENLAELLIFERLRPELPRLARIDGIEHLEAGLARGRGVVAVTGHIGSWEMLAAAVAARGFGITVVGRRPHEPALFELLEELRRSYGVETLWRESPGAAKQILRTLRQNRILAMLIDQDTQRVPQVIVPFFGRPARTPSGAATLALRSGAPLVPVFIHRTVSGHQITFEPPIDPAEAATDDDPVVTLTARLTRSIEEQVRRHPEQWVWWHRRWRV